MTIIPENTDVQDWVHRLHNYNGNNGNVLIMNGVDNVPTEHSPNLITSGGVFETERNIQERIDSVRNSLLGEYGGTYEPVYVFQIDTDESDPDAAVSYPINCVNANFNHATKDSLNDWANTFLGGIGACTLKEDGGINYWLDRANIFKKVDGTDAILTGADGNVMVALPKMYWKTTIKVSTWANTSIPASYKIETAISKGKFNNSVAWAHTMDGVEYPYVFVGVFQGLKNADNKLTSVYSDTENPTVSQTNDNMQTYAANNGDGYSIVTWHTWSMINLISILAYKTLDFQKAIGKGNCQTSAGLLLGTSYRAQAGGCSYGTQTNYDAMRIWYIENWFGDRWQQITGILKTEDNVFHINTANCRFVKQTTATAAVLAAAAADHVAIASGFSTSNGYISKFCGIDPFALLPASVESGASNKYACDYMWYAEGLRTVYVGGNWGYGAVGGAFTFNAIIAPSSTSTDRCARLQKIGTGVAAAA